MIYTRCLSRIRSEHFDEVYAIVRSMQKPISNVQQLRALAPSLNLFLEQQSMKKAGRWNSATFKSWFAPAFLKDMNSVVSIQVLDALVERSETKEIALVCYCGNETLCHRSLIAGLLQKHGVKVDTESGIDFSGFIDSVI